METDANTPVGNFIHNDTPATLFPLETSRIVATSAHGEIQRYLDDAFATSVADDRVFLPQQRVYAAKPDWHLRRTVKLDPVAEYYLYDVVYRNRGKFRAPFLGSRPHFGFRFAHGKPIPVHAAHADFSKRVSSFPLNWTAVQFDVAAYFNSIYHHDLATFVREAGFSSDDYQRFGRFLRETNAGRSQDCLPHGVYPAKMLGSAFLSGIQCSNRLGSAAIVRFMDDFVIADEDPEKVRGDFLAIQEMLGEFGLSINPGKTTEHRGISLFIGLNVSGLDALAEFEPGQEKSIASEAFQFGQETFEEDLAELRGKGMEGVSRETVVRVILGAGTALDAVGDLLPLLLSGWPTLVRHILVMAGVLDSAGKERIAEALVEVVRSGRLLTEHQLFWFARIAEECLTGTAKYGELLAALLESPLATPVSRARVLEIPDGRFGMTERRMALLRSGASGWEYWAAAVGCRTLQRESRNHVLKYFARGSIINRIVAGCVTAIPS